MATITYVGKAKVTAKVMTFTVVSGSDTTTYTLTLNGKTVSYTASAGNNATTIAAALLAAWDLRTEAEFEELTASVLAGVLTITGPDSGKPFTVTASVGGGTGTLTAATPTPASSPNHLNQAANYSGGALPTSGDTLVIEAVAPDILWELDALTAETVVIDRRDTHTGRIGLADIDEDGGYTQYRPTHLETAAVTLKVAQGSGDSARQVRLKSTAGALVTATITGPGGGRGTGEEAIELTGLFTNSVVNVAGASVVVSPLQGQTSNVATARVIGGVLSFGAGTTLAAATYFNSTGLIECSFSSLTLNAGSSATVRKAAAGTTTIVDDGTLTWESTGSPGTVTVGTNATFDASNAPAAFAVTDPLTVYEGGTLIDPAGRITRPYEIDVVRTEVDRVSLSLGTNLTLTVANGP